MEMVIIIRYFFKYILFYNKNKKINVLIKKINIIEKHYYLNFPLLYLIIIIFISFNYTLFT